MSNQTDKLKIKEQMPQWEDDYTAKLRGHLGKNTSIHTDLGIPPEFHGSEESLSTRFIRDSHISFAHFYLDQLASAAPPLTDEQIYAMWQEKSREK